MAGIVFMKKLIMRSLTLKKTMKGNMFALSAGVLFSKAQARKTDFLGFRSFRISF